MKRDVRRFFHLSLKDILRTGTLLPSTRWASRSIAKAVPAGSKVVLEYGSGDGTVTEAILTQLPQDGKLIAIEQNKGLVEMLHYISDPRLEVLEGDVVAKIPGLKERFPDGVDAIVSGIPFSLIPVELGDQILSGSVGLLRKQGLFIAYQNSLGLLKRLRRFFDGVAWTFEPRNFLPYFILTGRSPR